MVDPLPMVEEPKQYQFKHAEYVPYLIGKEGDLEFQARQGKYEISEEDLPSVAKAVIEMENKEQERKVYLDNPRILEEGYNLSLLDLPNTARYEDALQEYSRIQAEKNTGGMIQRNPYPYSPRPI